MTLVSVHCPELGRPVWLRPGTSDVTVYNETFSGLYHVPPDWMPVPSTVLDLGANIGLTAAHFKHMWPEARVVAVEPDPGNASMIARNAPGVDVRQVAVHGWAENGSLDGDQEYSKRLCEGYDVDVWSPHALVADLGSGPVDFAKIDIEGSEWSLLEGGALPFRALLVELHDGVPAWTFDQKLSCEGDALMIVEAQRLLARSGFLSQPHRVHPRAVFAWRA